MIKRLTFLFLLAISTIAQSGGNYVSVITEIPVSTFERGPGTTLTTTPDGTPSLNAGYGSTFSKDLGISPAQLQADPSKPGYVIDGVYTISFSLENYFRNPDGTPAGYPGYYEMQIDFGTQELCSFDGFGLDAKRHVTHTCLAPKYIVGARALPSGGPVQGHQNLVIHGSTWVSPGWQMYFSKFSVKFTPQS